MSECAVYFSCGKLQDGEWSQFGSMANPVQRFTPRSADFIDRPLTVPAGTRKSVYNRINASPEADLHILELLGGDTDEIEVWYQRDESDGTTGYATGNYPRWDVEFLTNKLPFTIPGYQAFVHATYTTDSGGSADLPNIGSSQTRKVGAFYRILLVNNGTTDLRVRQVYQK